MEQMNQHVIELHRTLDRATQGCLGKLTRACRETGLQPYIFVQTPEEGLPEGQMRLIVMGTDKQGWTRYFDVARLDVASQGAALQLKGIFDAREN